MSRNPSPARTVSPVRTASPARSTSSIKKIPQRIVDLGLIRMCDWRTGFLGENKATARELINNDDLDFRGTTALSTVYSAGNYYVDLEETSLDSFRSTRPVRLANAPMSNFSVAVCLKRENINSSNIVLSMWKATGTFRMFEIKVFNNANNNAISFLYTHNGTTNAERKTDSNTRINDTNFHVIECVFNPGAAADIYLDGVAAGTTQTLGSTQSVIFNAFVEIEAGGAQDAAGASVSQFDGKLGVWQLFNQSHTAGQALEISNYLTANYSF